MENRVIYSPICVGGDTPVMAVRAETGVVSEILNSARMYFIDYKHERESVTLSVNNHTIWVRLDGRPNSIYVTALVDTGATLSFIKSSVLSAEDVLQKSDSIYVTQLDGSVIRTLGTVTIILWLDDFNYMFQTFQVMDNLSFPMILGRDFLIENNIILQYDEIAKKLDPLNVVKTQYPFCIPSQSQMTIKALVGISNLDTLRNEFLFVSDNTRLPVGVCTANALVSIVDFEIPIIMCNYSTSAKRVESNVIIGNISQHSNTLFQTIDFTPDDKEPRGNSVKIAQEWQIPKIGEKVRQVGLQKAVIIPFKPPSINFENSILTPEEKGRVQNLCNHYYDCFATEEQVVGTCPILQHHIELKPGYTPVYKYPYRQPPEKAQLMQRLAKEQESQGIVERTYGSQWASPSFLVPKGKAQKDSAGRDRYNEWRMVVDLREVNKLTIPSIVPIPRIDSVIDMVGRHKPQIFTALDLKAGFHNINLTEESKAITSFMLPTGETYQHNKMPFGLCGSPRTMQLLMELVMAGLTYESVACYVDDVVIFSPTFERHLVDLEEVFLRLRGADLKLRSEKCNFCATKIKYLGHIMSSEGIYPNPQNITIINEMARPTDLKKVQRFLGMINYFRKFIKNCASECKPLTMLCKKEQEFEWKDEQEQAFKKLKRLLVEAPILAFADFDKTFILETDASKHALGAVLMQKDEDGKKRVIAYGARTLNATESRYDTGKLELLAVLWGMNYFKVYLLHRKFILRTDHKNLQWTLKHNAKSPQLFRWTSLIQNFDFDVEYITGTSNSVSDCLSRSDYETNINDAEDEFFKEATNPFVSVVTRSQTKKLRELEKEQSVPDNTLLEEFPPGEMLFEDHVNEGYKEIDLHAKKDKPRELDELPPDLLEEVSLLLTNLSEEKASQQFHKGLILTDVSRAQNNEPWIKGLKDYIMNGLLPKNEDLIRKILRREIDYFVKDDLLYRCYYNKGYGEKMYPLLVIPKSLVTPVIKMYHHDVMLNHPGTGKMLEILRLKYHWKGMQSSIVEYVRGCETCCKNKRLTRPIKPPMTLREPSVKPWSSVAIDALERLPKTKRGNKHIITVVDFYSRMIICFPVKDLTAATLISNFYNKVVCRFQGIERIYTDNGSMFISREFQEFVTNLNMKSIFSSAMHPQSNGLVERLQSNVLKLLRNLISIKQDNWDDYLPMIEATCNRIPAYATGHTPYLLIHGVESKSPLENNLINPLIEYGTVQETFGEIIKRQALVQKLMIKHMRERHEKMKERYDLHKHEVNLNVGDRVYLHVPRVNDRTLKLKLSKVYRGPYEIIDFTTPSTVRLKNLFNNKELTKSISIYRLKLTTQPVENNSNVQWDSSYGPAHVQEEFGPEELNALLQEYIQTQNDEEIDSQHGRESD